MGEQALTEAFALQQRGEFAAALPLFQAILAENPDHVDALQLQAISLHHTGRSIEAVASLEAAIRLQPRQSGFFQNLAEILRSLGRLGAAERACRIALDLQADNADAWFVLGTILQQAQRWDEAVSAFRAAWRWRPDRVAAAIQLGMLLDRLGRAEDALIPYQDAFQRAPGHPVAAANLGNMLQRLGRFEAAEAVLRRALVELPGNVPILVNLGNTLKDLGQSAEAEACCRAVLEREPGHPEANFNLGLLRLRAGDFRAGWPLYEWRWQLQMLQGLPGPADLPRWTGGALETGTVLIQAEQGFGDTLQFCRYLPQAAEIAPLVVEVQPALVRLLAYQVGRGWPGRIRVVPTGTPVPDAVATLPLMSLPGLFGTELANILAGSPYLIADPQAVAGWRAKLAQVKGRKIGLVWQGHQILRTRRSIPAALLNVLADVPGVSFVSLQLGAVDRPALDLVDVTAGLGDFMETAALMGALDLVISIDTAAAHLAGALAVPCWVLLRDSADWRWLENRGDSPWYPGMRLFRQPVAGDWAGVLGAVRAALQAWVQKEELL